MHLAFLYCIRSALLNKADNWITWYKIESWLRYSPSTILRLTNIFNTCSHVLALSVDFYCFLLTNHAIGAFNLPSDTGLRKTSRSTCEWVHTVRRCGRDVDDLRTNWKERIVLEIENIKIQGTLCESVMKNTLTLDMKIFTINVKRVILRWSLITKNVWTVKFMAH